MSESYLSDESVKDKPWDKNRALVDQVKQLYRGTEFESYAERLVGCSRVLEFCLAHIGEGERVFKLQSAFFCRVRHCPICQWRRSLMWKARALKAMPNILNDYPTAKWLFLTLTVKNCQVTDLRSTISHMNQSFERLTKRKAWPAIGYMKSVEVTPGLTHEGSQKPKKQRTVEDYDFNYCHPHFHVLMMVPAGYFKGKSYIKQAKWVDLWQSCLRVDYSPVVDIRQVKPNPKRITSEDQGVTEDAFVSALKEVFKYTVKGEDLVMNAGFLLEITHQLHKTRAVALGGVIRNYLAESEPDDEDLIHGDDEPGESAPDDPKWWFSWREMEKRYKGQEKEQFDLKTKND